MTASWPNKRSFCLIVFLFLFAAKLSIDVILSERLSTSNRHEQDLRLDEFTISTKKSGLLYAYAFVIGGCNPDDGRYKGFIYNVLVATRLLRQEGSRKADIVVMIQMSQNTTANELPLEDVRFLSAMKIQILYLQKSQHDSFYATVLHKFCILNLVQYRRVLLMDADVMPLGNLDYLFELSYEQKMLKENVVVAGPMEPANGGLFMLEPNPGDYRRLLDIVAARQKHGEKITNVDSSGYQGYKFDPVYGWGHVIEPPDQWVARRPGETGTNWTFLFAFSDQGLLYHCKIHTRAMLY
jgi:hypothetical protein